jgi:hypothetical protein
MESKLADPDPPVKETDPRVTESPDPNPKRHGSAKMGDLRKKLIATNTKDERVITLT